jgi:hypothetical protein
MVYENDEHKIKDLDSKEDIYGTIPRGGVGAELGVCKGVNAVQLFFRTKPSLLFLVDTWEETARNHHIEDPNLWFGDHFDYVSNIFRDEIEREKVVLHKQRSLTFLNSLPDNVLDWVYLDSDHHYQNVSRELEMSILKVKSGGHIMGHDYVVNTTVWGSSVIRAVTERIQNKDIEMISISKEIFPTYCTKVL